MGPLDLLWHMGNLFAVPLLMGVLAASGAKLLWRQALAAVPLRRLALWTCAVCSACTLLGLVWFGRDGKMATYALMVPVCALALWWRGFGPGLRRTGGGSGG